MGSVRRTIEYTRLDGEGRDLIQVNAYESDPTVAYLEVSDRDPEYPSETVTIFGLDTLEALIAALEDARDYLKAQA